MKTTFVPSSMPKQQEFTLPRKTTFTPSPDITNVLVERRPAPRCIKQRDGSVVFEKSPVAVETAK